MICISVTPRSRQLAKVDLLNAANHCDLVELCLDHLIKEPNVAEMLEGIAKPIIVSCRRPQEGGAWQGTEDQRMTLLRNAIVAGPAYVELEADTAAKVPRFGNTQRVVAYTNPRAPLGDVEALYGQAVGEYQADVVKFTCRTETLEEAWSLLKAVSQKRSKPVVGVGVGRSSRMLQILGLRYGSPWVYAALEKGMEAHPNQATLFELNEVYDAQSIGKGTRFVGVVDYPQEQESKAVRVLNEGFRHIEQPIRCLPIHLGGSDRTRNMLDALKMNALLLNPQAGAHARLIAEHFDRSASESDCADLVFKQKDGWTAYALFWKLALKALEAKFPQPVGDEKPLDRKNVALLGAGGLSQAMAYGICRRKGLLSVTAPDDDEAAQLASRFNVRHLKFSAIYDSLADVVVIADPNVRAGHHRSEVNPSYLRPGMTVMDVCRIPDETELLQEARERGCQVVEPQGIFREHLAAQFKSMTGQELPESAFAVLQP